MKIFNQNFTQYMKDIAAWELRQQTTPSTAISQGKGKKKKHTDPKPVAPKKPYCRMHPDEPEMILRLAACLKIFMARSTNDQAIPRAVELLQEYLFDFKRVSDNSH
jgi:hypothetical protein